MEVLARQEVVEDAAGRWRRGKEGEQTGNGVVLCGFPGSALTVAVQGARSKRASLHGISGGGAAEGCCRDDLVTLVVARPF